MREATVIIEKHVISIQIKFLLPALQGISWPNMSHLSLTLALLLIEERARSALLNSLDQHISFPCLASFSFLLAVGFAALQKMFNNG